MAKLRVEVVDSLTFDQYLNEANTLKELDPVKELVYLDSAEALLPTMENCAFCQGRFELAKGAYLMRRGSMNEAVDKLETSIDLLKPLNESSFLFDAHTTLAWILMRTGKQVLASKHVFEAEKMCDVLKDTLIWAKSYHFIGHLNYYQKNFEKALEYHLKALKIRNEFGDIDSQITSNINVGISYYQQDIDDSALLHYTEALEIALANNKVFDLSFCYNNIAMILADQGKHKESNENLMKALDIRRAVSDTSGILFGQTYIAKNFMEMGDTEEAISRFEEVIHLSEKIDFVDIMKNACQEMSTIYEQLGQHDKALEYEKKAHILTDTIANRQKIQELADAQTKYETEKKEKELLLANQQIAEADLKAVQRNNQLLLMSIALILILSVAGFLYYRNKQHYKAHIAKVRIEEQEKGLSAMIQAQEEERQRIAKDLHDGIVQELGSNIIRWRNLFSSTQPDKKNAEGLISSLESANTELRALSHQMMPKALETVGVVSATREMLDRSLNGTRIAHSFEFFGIEKRLPEKVEIPLYRIAQELVQNVIKHSQANELIVQLYKSGDAINLIVEDNGVGIKNSANGHGIGIQNIKSRLAPLQGELNIEPSPKKGTLVNVKIPL